MSLFEKLCAFCGGRLFPSGRCMRAHDFLTERKRYAALVRENFGRDETLAERHLGCCCCQRCLDGDPCGKCRGVKGICAEHQRKDREAAWRAEGREVLW